MPSVEPSSTTMICLSSGSAFTCSSTVRIVAVSLNAGIRKETLGTRGVYGPGRSAFGPFTILVALAAVAGLALRVWILASPMGALDSDEAVSGLMARHMLDGEFSALYWLGNYGGTLESAVAALVFAVFGSSVIALKLTTLGLWIVAAVLTWRVGIRTIGRRPAQAAAALFWIAPTYMVWWSTKARAFYAMGVVLGLLVVLLALRLREHGSRRDAAALGLVLGLGWWTSPESSSSRYRRSSGFCGGGRVSCGWCRLPCPAS